MISADFPEKAKFYRPWWQVASWEPFHRWIYERFAWYGPSLQLTKFTENIENSQINVRSTNKLIKRTEIKEEEKQIREETNTSREILKIRKANNCFAG